MRSDRMSGSWWDRFKTYSPHQDGTSDRFDEDGYQTFGPDASGRGGSREIVVRFPQTLDDAQAAADCLKQYHPIVVNLERADASQARRIVDFLAGVCFALDGHSKRVGESIFLFTPHALTINTEEQSFLSNSAPPFHGPPPPYQSSHSASPYQSTVFARPQEVPV